MTEILTDGQTNQPHNACIETIKTRKEFDKVMKLQAQGWIRKRRSILRRLEEKTFQTKGGLVSDIHNNELYLIILHPC